jgi:aromatic-L-amino-acid decarboxylase
MGAILREVENKIFANSTLYLSPRFFGYINSGGNQASILGELLASAVNQICAMWHFSPAVSEVERRVIRWIAQFIGYAPEAGGCLYRERGMQIGQTLEALAERTPEGALSFR